MAYYFNGSTSTDGTLLSSIDKSTDIIEEKDKKKYIIEANETQAFRFVSKRDFVVFIGAKTTATYNIYGIEYNDNNAVDTQVFQAVNGQTETINFTGDNSLTFKACCGFIVKNNSSEKISVVL